MFFHETGVEQILKFLCRKEAAAKHQVLRQPHF